MKFKDFMFNSNRLTCDHCGKELNRDDSVRIRWREDQQTVEIVCGGCEDLKRKEVNEKV